MPADVKVVGPAVSGLLLRPLLIVCLRLASNSLHGYSHYGAGGLEATVAILSL